MRKSTKKLLKKNGLGIKRGLRSNLTNPNLPTLKQKEEEDLESKKVPKKKRRKIKRKTVSITKKLKEKFLTKEESNLFGKNEKRKVKKQKKKIKEDFTKSNFKKILKKGNLDKKMMDYWNILPEGIKKNKNKKKKRKKQKKNFIESEIMKKKKFIFDKNKGKSDFDFLENNNVSNESNHSESDYEEDSYEFGKSGDIDNLEDKEKYIKIEDDKFDVYNVKDNFYDDEGKNEFKLEYNQIENDDDEEIIFKKTHEKIGYMEKSDFIEYSDNESGNLLKFDDTEYRSKKKKILKKDFLKLNENKNENDKFVSDKKPFFNKRKNSLSSKNLLEPYPYIRKNSDNLKKSKKKLKKKLTPNASSNIMEEINSNLFNSFKKNKRIEKKNEKKKRNIIKINFITNYGHKQKTGLTEIKIFNKNYKEIELKYSKIKFYKNKQNKSNKSLFNIINNKIETTNKKYMFYFTGNLNKDEYTLKIELLREEEIGFILLWNFNEDISKGLKSCEIFLKDKKIFGGDIKQGASVEGFFKYYNVFKIFDDVFFEEKFKRLIKNMNYSNKEKLKKKEIYKEILKSEVYDNDLNDKEESFEKRDLTSKTKKKTLEKKTKKFFLLNNDNLRSKQILENLKKSDFSCKNLQRKKLLKEEINFDSTYFNENDFKKKSSLLNEDLNFILDKKPKKRNISVTEKKQKNSFHNVHRNSFVPRNGNDIFILENITKAKEKNENKKDFQDLLKLKKDHRERKFRKNNKNLFYKKSETPSKKRRNSNFKETSNAKKLKRKNSFYELKRKNSLNELKDEQKNSIASMYKKKILKSENFIKKSKHYGKNDDYDFNKKIDSFKNFKNIDFIYKNKKKEDNEVKNVYKKYDKNKEFFKEIENKEKKNDMENFNFEESEVVNNIRDNRLFTFENCDIIDILADEKKKTPKKNKKLYHQKKNFLKITKNSLSNKIFEKVKKKEKALSPKSEFLKTLLKKNKNLKIPKTPLISGLTLILLSNHGDEKFIGLNGFEIFTKKGKKIDLTQKAQIYLKIKKSQKTLKSSNHLRLLSNHITKDVNKHWICDYSKNNFSRILIDLEKSVEISMIRIWNYNCSRIRANRGVKKLVILDKNLQKVLFYGEIKMASGSLVDSKKNFENILFTQDPEILKKIGKYDTFFNFCKNKERNKNSLDKNLNKRFRKRPITRDKENDYESSKSKNNYFLRQNFMKKEDVEKIDTKLYSFLPNQKKDCKKEFLKTKILKFFILQTWENKNDFCIKGFDFFDKENNLINPDNYIYKTNARYNYMIKNEKSLNILLKKKKPVFLTILKNEKTYIEIKFKNSQKISLIKFFSVFKNKKSSLKNIKKIKIITNEKPLLPKDIFFIKKASEIETLSNFHKIEFPIINPNNKLIGPFNPNCKWLSGFRIEFHLKATFGDPFYIGLNEIEIWDLNGKNILKKNKNYDSQIIKKTKHYENSEITKKINNYKITALPPGVMIDPEMITDKRVIKNITNSVKTSNLYKNNWLTFFTKDPIKCLHYKKNIIAIDFDQPVTLALINIYNYTKTRTRSVKQIEIYLDKNLIYSGFLNDPFVSNLSSIIFSPFDVEKTDKGCFFKPVVFEEEREIGLVCEGDVVRSWDEVKLDRPYTGKFH